MVTYKEAINFIKENTNKIRGVIIATEHCSACPLIQEVLQQAHIPFVVMDGEDEELVFKPGTWPQTTIFSKENNCYSRYDIFNNIHLEKMLKDIERWEAINIPKAA